MTTYCSQFVHVVALLVDAQRALELREGLTHREVTLASGEQGGVVGLLTPAGTPACTPEQQKQGGWICMAGHGSRPKHAQHACMARTAAVTSGLHEPHRAQSEHRRHAFARPCADVVSEGRLLLIVANKLDSLNPAQRQQALALIRQTVEDSLPDVR